MLVWNDDTNDAEHLGRPNSAVTPENNQNLHKLILANCNSLTC